MGDEVVFERFQGGAKPTLEQTIMSGTKSFACAITALAIADGKLARDERVADTIPELAKKERSAAITVRDLLTQTSGIKGGGTPLGGDHHAWIREKAWLLTGTKRFTYGAAHWDLFGAFVKAKLGEDPIDYLERRVLKPIGMTWSYWKTDGVGQRFLAFGMITTPRSWARYGMLIRDDGMFEGQRILPAGTRDACLHGSETNPAYGEGWWLNQPMPRDAKKHGGFPKTVARLVNDGERASILPDGPADLAMAVGSNDLRLYVIASRDMVIVRYGGRDDATFKDADLLRPILMPSR